MALKQFTIESQILAASKHCRLDEKYTFFTYVSDWIVFNSKIEQVPLSYFLQEIKTVKVQKGELEEEAFLVNISDQQQRSGELENIEITTEIGSDKTYLGNADILVSKLGMPKGYIFINTYKGKNILGSTEFIPYSIKDSSYLVYLKYILLHPRMLKSYASLESGKTPSHRRVNPYEFLKIKIPLIPGSICDQITVKIKPIEDKIEKLKTRTKGSHEIINKVFAREFGFDENLYNVFGKGMTFGTQTANPRKPRFFDTKFIEFAKITSLRSSTRFHNPPTKELLDFINNNLETIQVKDIVESYEKGIQPKYDLYGEIPVVKIANLKNGYIDFLDTENISRNDFENLNDKKKLKQNDIILCSTGKVSLGKVDYYDYENESITTVDNYILRLNENYNPLFFTYFFRSILGYFQIERDFTGTTNQIHLYWDQISNFQIPNIVLQEQQKIVDEIKAELDEQIEIKRQIGEERNKIYDIIDKAIT